MTDFIITMEDGSVERVEALTYRVGGSGELILYEDSGRAMTHMFADRYWKKVHCEEG